MVSWGAVCASLALVVLLASPASALRIDIPLNPVLGQDTLPTLDYTPSPNPGVGEWSAVFKSAAFVPTPYANVVGQRIQYTFDFIFGPAVDPNWEVEYMLVFLSVRRGNPPAPNCASVAPGGNLPLADFHFASNGYSGDFLAQTQSTDSPVPGENQVCSGEYDFEPWDSLIFDALPNTPFEVTFEIEQTANSIDTSQISELNLRIQGFSAVPEPSSGLLLLVGLVGLVGTARSRRSCRH